MLPLAIWSVAELRQPIWYDLATVAVAHPSDDVSAVTVPAFWLTRLPTASSVPVTTYSVSCPPTGVYRMRPSGACMKSGWSTITGVIASVVGLNLYSLDAISCSE